jgi:hypothetical protein
MTKKEQMRGNTLTSLGSRLLSFDSFGEDVGFTVKDGHRTKGTWLGLFFTTLIGILILSYAKKTADEMSTGANTTHLSYVDSNFYGDTDKRVKIGDLNIALAIEF